GRTKPPDPRPPAPPHSISQKPRPALQALPAGMRLARKITQQPAIAPLVAEEILPGASIKSDADFEKAIRANGLSNLHPVGTCRMGSDDAAVCDPRLRVNGGGHLRVVDASIMATGPSGQPTPPTITLHLKAP